MIAVRALAWAGDVTIVSAMARTWLSIEFMTVQARPRRRNVGTAPLSSAAPRPESDGLVMK